MSDAPEDRQAAARRVAQEIVDQIGGPPQHLDPESSWEFAAAAMIRDALLAFPGGDAEPVAWMHDNGKLTDNKGDDVGLVELWIQCGDGDKVTPLYAAPGARVHDPLCLGCVACDPVARPPKGSPHA